jgi:hypothetical protein
MRNSVCKRIAKSFELQRYIPEYQVYELCINWESEIPIPPTIFYLSEIFIYPYNVHQQPTGIKKEVTPLFLDSETMIEQDSAVAHKLSKSQIAEFRPSDPDSRTTALRTLDYDKVATNRALVNEIKTRNRLIVRHVEYKSQADPRKKRKS